MPHSSPHFPPDRLDGQPAEQPPTAGSSPSQHTHLTPAQRDRAQRLRGAATSNGVAAATAVAEAATATRKPTERAGKLFQPSERTQSLMGVQVVGTGSYVPDHVVSNAELETQYGFEPGWIEQRTGILSRRYAAPGQATSHLCAEAAIRAIRQSQVDPAQIDLLVVGTFTPDFYCPSTACLVQEILGLDVPAFDVNAACSGFVYALVTAAQYVATGNSQLALVVGGDTNSRVVKSDDQGTAPLFGDGAGAVLLARGTREQGLLCYQLGADGSGGPLLKIPAGGTMCPVTPDLVAAGDHYLQMDGRSVFKWAVQALAETIALVLRKTNLSVEDVAGYFAHQANMRIISKAMQQLGIPAERVFNNLERYGNTSAASIPLALDEAVRNGQIHAGQTLLLSGFGAGLTWGTALFKW